MKKAKWHALAMIAGAMALVFGSFAGCSNDGGGGNGGGQSGPDVGGGSNPTNDPSGIDIPEVSIEGNYSPAAGATAAYEDGVLMIKFDSAPSINRSADLSVKIFESNVTEPYDTIKAVDEKLTSNAKNTSYQAVNVKEQLISVNGNVVVIKPHKALENDKTYYVNIDNGLISAGGFAGISDSTTWSFTTRAAPTISGDKITVGSDKNYSTVQGALNYLLDKSGNWTIEIDEGYYNELLSYSGSANVTMVGMQEGFDARSGEDGNVVIYWQNADLWNGTTRSRMAFLWEGGDLTIKNLTIANTIDRAVIGKDGTQAEALYYDATGKIVAYNASFKSHQDTLLIGNNGGRGWFYQCYIEGDTDFIWGYPHTVLFEECQIRCLYDDAPQVTEHTSYIFASRSVATAANNKGLVLYNCDIDVDNGVTAYYGRNSGSDTQAAVVYSKFSNIAPALWFSGATQYDQDIEGVCSIGYKDYGNVYDNGTEIPTDSRNEEAFGLSKEVAEREYCGRNAILNRGWDAKARKYVAVRDIWDLSELETEFNASEDKSKNMLYIEPTYVPYLAGKNTQKFTVTDYKGDAVEGISWNIDNTLATVENGTVTANENITQTAVLTASAGEMSGIARINIIPAEVEPTGLSFSRDGAAVTESITIMRDDSITLDAIFAPADTTDKSVVWSSSDTNVLRVASVGPTDYETSAVVTGFSVGTATITATSVKYPQISTSVEIKVDKVYSATYLAEGVYTKNASIADRDATIVAEPVTYGFAGGLAVAEPAPEIAWTVNGGWPFEPSPSGTAVSAGDGEDFAWADFKIRAAGDISLDSVSSIMYCSASSNIRGKVYVKIDDGEFVEKGEAPAERKCMSFTKQDISTELEANQTATIRVAIANIAGKTMNKNLKGVIGNVVIYYTPKGEPVPFPGANGTYNLIDYHTGATGQNTSIEDGTTADGMISWSGLKYHSANYGAYSPDGNGTLTIKVGGPSVISIVGSQYGSGTLTATNSTGEVIVGPVSTKMASDQSIATRTLSFLYTGSGEDTLTLTLTHTTYVGTITVSELTTEKAEVKSVTVNGAETVSTAVPSQFTATVETTYCASTAVTWSSSDENVAKVSETGLVTGVAAGTATITATSTVDSTKKGSVTIEVTEDELNPVAGTTYSYNFKDKTAADYVSNTASTAGTSPDTFLSWNDKWNAHSYGLQSTTGAAVSIKVAGDVVVGFTGYNAAKGIMKVTDADDNVVLESMPMGTGSDSTTKWFIYKGEATTLTLTQISGDTYISTLTVKPWTDEVPTVTSVNVNGAGTVVVGSSITLSATVATEYFADTSVTWSSGDTGIATVDANGVVTGVAAGTTTITATSKANNAISGSKTVTVTSGEASPIYGYTYSYSLINVAGNPYNSNDTFLKVTGDSNNGSHGIVMKNGSTAVLKVAGAGTITLNTCAYDAGAAVTVTGSNGTSVGTITVAAGDSTNDATKATFEYTGAADTLTLTWDKGSNYLHGISFTPAQTSTTYTLTGGVGTPYSSDDGLLAIKANGDNDGHGLIMKDGDTVKIDVAGACKIYLLRCQYDKSATITLTSSDATVIETKTALGATTTDGGEEVFTYTGEEDTLTFTWSAGTGGHYLHGIRVDYAAQ